MAEKEVVEQPLDGQEAQVLEASIRPSTDANFFIQIVMGLVGTLGVSFGMLGLKGRGALGDYANGLINNRGPIQYIELFMFFMVLAQIILKMIIVRRQMAVINSNPVDARIDLTDEVQLQNLRKRVINNDSFSSSIALSRLDRILGLWIATKDMGRVVGWAGSESGRDVATSDQSYALSRVLIWAIPIMGFIGTVQGLGAAVAGFASFLQGSAELSQIKGAIANVTIGLGVAFDTTFLALILVTFLMFPITSVQRREEAMLVEIDIYLDENYISRFPSPEQQPIVIENLEDSIEAAFRRYIPDPDRYDEVFTRSIEKAAEAVEQRFAGLTEKYELNLKDTTDKLSVSLTSVGESLQHTMIKVVDDLQKQEDALMLARREVANEEARSLRETLGEVHERATKLAGEYIKSAESLQKATTESMQQTAQVSSSLTEKLQEVMRIAAGIEELLKIEQVIRKSIDAVASAEEFQQTLRHLREHLTTTDSFCRQLSQPRTITLYEESTS